MGVALPAFVNPRGRQCAPGESFELFAARSRWSTSAHGRGDGLPGSRFSGEPRTAGQIWLAFSCARYGTRGRRM